MHKIIIFLSALFLFTALNPARAATADASFALGCFWCAEHDFEGIKGVKDVVSGYEGGTKDTATYDQVSRGDTGHFETVKVTYDPAVVTYDQLLGVFWDNVDPFDTEGQFCDKGAQYSAIIFTGNDAERDAARKSLTALQSRHPDQPVAVRILDAKPFYPAEAHHQNFADTNAVHYKLYRAGCGRDAKLEELRKTK